MVNKWWAVISTEGWGILDIFPAKDLDEACCSWKKSNRTSGECERLVEVEILEKKIKKGKKKHG